MAFKTYYVGSEHQVRHTLRDDDTKAKLTVDAQTKFLWSLNGATFIIENVVIHSGPDGDVSFTFATGDISAPGSLRHRFRYVEPSSGRVINKRAETHLVEG